MTLANNVTPIEDKTVFDERLRNLIEQLEGNEELPYYDSKGIATIGIGFNLREPNIRLAVFDAINVDLEDDALVEALRDIVLVQRTKDDSEILQAELDEALGSQFIMTPTQIDNVFADKARGFIEIAENKSGLPLSDELIALTSLVFNHPDLFGPGLEASLNLPDPHEARAEAWYQIRYIHADELWKRRFIEADVFGLYGDENLVTEDMA